MTINVELLFSRNVCPTLCRLFTHTSRFLSMKMKVDLRLTSCQHNSFKFCRCKWRSIEERKKPSAVCFWWQTCRTKSMKWFWAIQWAHFDSIYFVRMKWQTSKCLPNSLLFNQLSELKSLAFATLHVKKQQNVSTSFLDTTLEYRREKSLFDFGNGFIQNTFCIVLLLFYIFFFEENLVFPPWSSEYQVCLSGCRIANIL